MRLYMVLESHSSLSRQHSRCWRWCSGSKTGVCQRGAPPTRVRVTRWINGPGSRALTVGDYVASLTAIVTLNPTHNRQLTHTSQVINPLHTRTQASTRMVEGARCYTAIPTTRLSPCATPSTHTHVTATLPFPVSLLSRFHEWSS